jgi:hypothetical protein
MATDSAKRDGPALLFHSGGQFYCFCASDSTTSASMAGFDSI